MLKNDEKCKSMLALFKPNKNKTMRILLQTTLKVMKSNFK